MPLFKNRFFVAGGILIFSAAVGIAVYMGLKKPSGMETTDSDSATYPAQEQRPTVLSSQEENQKSSASSQPGRPSDQAGLPVNEEDIHSTLDKNNQTADTLFTRGEYFKSVNWGTDLKGLPEKENQKLNFRPTCKSHKRADSSDSHPADWAEQLTKTDSVARWPAAATHVIDWNQFWQLGDKGLQISIRWNFESPARYNVVGYSFALSNPDGFGTALWQDMPEMSWDEAKDFVIKWEQKTLAEGGKAGTRTMSVAEKLFNPAEVSTEDIERAEYKNSRVRSAQSGKMHCSSPAQASADLNCNCWF